MDTDLALRKMPSQFRRAVDIQVSELLMWSVV
jgi:hypothetical protein